jgi:hypothetical protein
MYADKGMGHHDVVKKQRLYFSIANCYRKSLQFTRALDYFLLANTFASDNGDQYPSV